MEFSWMNKSTITKDGEKITIMAPPKTDYFRYIGNNGDLSRSPEGIDNAPFYYTEVEGDFVMRVHMAHDFKDTYDATAIMVYENEFLWAKACFEYTDLGTHAVVSVVTRGYSDDANGCNLDRNDVWLQVCRVGNYFAFHYSLDGEKYDMMRYFLLPVDHVAKVGVVAQSPMGNGGERYFDHLTIEKRTVSDIRAGK